MASAALRLRAFRVALGGVNPNSAAMPSVSVTTMSIKALVNSPFQSCCEAFRAAAVLGFVAVWSFFT